MATGGAPQQAAYAVLVAILRDAALRTAPQDEVVRMIEASPSPQVFHSPENV
jgi:hypothetical protein